MWDKTLFNKSQNMNENILRRWLTQTSVYDNLMTKLFGGNVWKMLEECHSWKQTESCKMEGVWQLSLSCKSAWFDWKRLTNNFQYV